MKNRIQIRRNIMRTRSDLSFNCKILPNFVYFRLNSLHFRPPGRLPVEPDQPALLLGPAGLAEGLQPLLQAGQLLAMLGEGRHTHLLQPGLRIRINSSGSNTDPDPIRIQGFNDQKMKKIRAEKKKIFKIKNYNLPIPRPP
jgi:hypothetical protein